MSNVSEGSVPYLALAIKFPSSKLSREYALCQNGRTVVEYRQTPKDFGLIRSFRILSLVGLMCSSLLPLFHSLIFGGGVEEALERYPLRHTGYMLYLFLLGTVVHVTKLPEKWWPGRSDIWVSTVALVE